MLREKGRVDGVTLPTFVLPLLRKKMVPWEVPALPGTLLVWPLKWGDNAKEVVGTQTRWVEKIFLVVQFFPNQETETGRDFSCLSPQVPVRTGVGQEVGAPSTVLMVWVEICQA